MAEAFIYDALRTPRGRGKADGKLHEITPIALATQTLEAIRARNAIDVLDVEDVILGCVTPVAEQGTNVARTAVLNAGYADETPGVQINRFCASALEAVNMVAAKVITGEIELGVAGGVECMSRVPMGSDGGAWAIDPAVAIRTFFVPQGISADVIATVEDFSRTDVDSYAVESQRRAAHAWQEGYFSKSIVPVHDVMGEIVLDHDEHMRPETTLEALAALRPSFEAMGRDMPGFDELALMRYPELERINHVHHAGNSSGIVDGASAVLVGNRAIGDKYGQKPRARILGAASIGAEPLIMLTGPTYAARKLLKRLKMTPADIDIYEVNEAFASVVLRVLRHLGIPHEKTNVNGGAIAMGHPLGATGAMLLGTALDELERTGKERALVTLCVAQGMATAMVIERV